MNTTTEETTTNATRHRIATLLSTARDTRATRRAAAVERRRLAAELADYASPADRNDLNALLDTYPDSDVAELRDLLNRRGAA